MPNVRDKLIKLGFNVVMAAACKDAGQHLKSHCIC